MLTDFYNSTMKLCLLGHLRDERKFSSIDELRNQIHLDITNTNAVLTHHSEMRTISTTVLEAHDAIAILIANGMKMFEKWDIDGFETIWARF